MKNRENYFMENNSHLYPQTLLKIINKLPDYKFNENIKQ